MRRGRHGICIPISYGSNSHKHDSFLESVVDLERFTIWSLKRLPELANSGSFPGGAGDFPDHQLLRYRMQNMKKLLSWATQVVASPTSTQAEQAQPWEDRRSQSRCVTHRICPHQFEENNGGIGV